MTDDRIAYTIPRVFFDDHINRELPPFSQEIYGLPEGTIVKSTKSTYTVLLTGDETDELLSDADYYSDPVIARDMMDGNRQMIGLISSARATVKRIKAQRA